MKTAKELLLDYLENIGNPDFQIELFADDAVFELPILPVLAYQLAGKVAKPYINF